MSFLRRNRKPREVQSDSLLDYRKVSNRVHERRAERERDPAIFRQIPEEAEREVRTYLPQERLRAVDEEARQLVEDSRDIPKTWDSDFHYARTPLSIEFQYVAAFIVDVILSGPVLFWIQDESPSHAIVGLGIIMAFNAALIVASITYHRDLGKIAIVGWAFAVGLIIICIVVANRLG